MAHPELIVEDGTIVTDADSFVTRADYVSYAEDLGFIVGSQKEQREALRKAAIFIGTFEGRLKGSLVERDQPLAYPRKDLVLEGFEYADNEIPRIVILAQMQLAIDLQAGIDIYNPPQSESVAVKREKVDGAVEVEYAVKESAKLSRRSTSTALVAALLEYSGLRIVLERS